MKLVVVKALFYLSLIQIINARRVRCNFNDEIYPYDIDSSVIPYKELFNEDNFILEQIDDDTLLADGYIEFIESMNPKFPLAIDLKTYYFEKGVWKEGTIRLTEKDLCTENLNPSRFWYNITKLWTQCPPQQGDKWVVEKQYIDLEINLPATLPSTPWKWYFLMNQNAPGFINKSLIGLKKPADQTTYSLVAEKQVQLKIHLKRMGSLRISTIMQYKMVHYGKHMSDEPMAAQLNLGQVIKDDKLNKIGKFNEISKSSYIPNDYDIGYTATNYNFFSILR